MQYEHHCQVYMVVRHTCMDLLLSGNNYICENIDSSSGDMLKKNCSQFQHRFAVCGEIFKVYGILLTPNHKLNAYWLFQLHANKNVITNITLLSLEGSTCLASRYKVLWKKHLVITNNAITGHIAPEIQLRVSILLEI